MKKVLFCLSSLSLTNGVAAFIMNQYEENLKNEVKIDFFIVKPLVDTKYKAIIEKNKSKIYIAPKTSKLNRYFKIKKYIINEVLSKDKYDIIHINLVDIFAIACADAAQCRVKEVIYHVHNPKVQASFQFFRNILNKLMIKKANKLYACSQFAGESMFNDKKFTIVRNLIDIERFKFNEINRKKIRNELGIGENEIIIGTIARITEQKNPFIMLDIFKKLNTINKNYNFLWVGEGNMKETVEKYILKNNINNCFLVGEKNNVEDYYSSFDIFMLLSKFEGMGIVFIEAQASGLITFASSNVPADVSETELVNICNLENVNEIVSEICEISKYIGKSRTEYNQILLENSKYSKLNDKNFLYNIY